MCEQARLQCVYYVCTLGVLCYDNVWLNNYKDKLVFQVPKSFQAQFHHDQHLEKQTQRHMQDYPRYDGTVFRPVNQQPCYSSSIGMYKALWPASVFSKDFFFVK